MSDQLLQQAVDALGTLVRHYVPKDSDDQREGLSALVSFNAAIQQQLKPVALKDGVPNTEAAIAYALERWGYRQGTKECIAFYRGACWMQLAASPSTTQGAT